jgi:hypothetical protein
MKKNLKVLAYVILISPLSLQSLCGSGRSVKLISEKINQTSNSTNTWIVKTDQDNTLFQISVDDDESVRITFYLKHTNYLVDSANLKSFDKLKKIFDETANLKSLGLKENFANDLSFFEMILDNNTLIVEYKRQNFTGGLIFLTYNPPNLELQINLEQFTSDADTFIAELKQFLRNKKIDIPKKYRKFLKIILQTTLRTAPQYLGPIIAAIIYMILVSRVYHSTTSRILKTMVLIFGVYLIYVLKNILFHSNLPLFEPIDDLILRYFYFQRERW